MPAYKDSKGKWYVKFYAENWDGTKKQVLKRGFSLKSEALAYEYEFKANKKHSPDVSLQSLYDTFIDDYKTNNRLASYNVTKVIIEKHILPIFGSMAINEITPLQCRKWQNSIKEKGYKDNTAKNIEMCFRKLMNFAVRYYNLSKSPFSVLSSIGKTTRKHDVISMDEYKAMEKLFAPLPVKVSLRLLFYSGLRLSEMRGLMASDFDFKNGKLKIERQFLRNAPAPLKTAGSKRVISVPGFVLDDIKEFFDSFQQMPQYPFTIVAAKTIRSKLITYCDAIGIKPITPHTLRHSHATLLITNKIPINIVSRRLGHANITTTLNVYAHCFKDSEDEVVSLLESVSNEYQSQNKKTARPRKARKNDN